MMPAEPLELNRSLRAFLEAEFARAPLSPLLSVEMMKRGLIAVVALLAVIYLGDYGWLALRARRNQNAFGSVTLDTYYSVKLKSGKTEFDYAGPQVVECVNSLLPHMGDKPCWYASRKKEQQIDIDSGDPNNVHVF